MCGVVGVISVKKANYQIFDALMMLQHRGQDAAGITTAIKDNIYQYKNKGLVKEVFSQEAIKSLEGDMGIGHVRYPTSGNHECQEESQPLYVDSPLGISMVHNGNIINATELREFLLKEDWRRIHTKSDSEVIINLFSYEFKKCLIAKQDIKTAIFNASAKIQEQCVGSFSLVFLILGFGLVAIRDLHGIRPFVLGIREKNEYMVASESVALDVNGYKLERDIEPGEIILISENGEISCKKNSKAKLNPCLFEYVYFARPDSLINGINVHHARMNMGKIIAKQIKEKYSHLDIDVVIPIPDTSRTSAYELACALDKPYREGFIKNRYIGRTFIMPEQDQREDSVKRKINTIRSEFEGKNVLLVDDSIVRGTTSKKIISMVRECGVKKVYFCSVAPEVKFQNVYGINMPSCSDLIANKCQNPEDFRQSLNVDEIIFQTLEDLIESVKSCNPEIKEFDTSVFDGNYITGGVSKEYLSKIDTKPNEQLKLGF